MPKEMVFILGIVIVLAIISGLVTGKIIAGSRGLKANYYSRKENPFLYYAFIFIYSVIAFLIFNNSK